MESCATHPMDDRDDTSLFNSLIRDKFLNGILELEGLTHKILVDLKKMKIYRPLVRDNRFISQKNSIYFDNACFD
jgi:hypothetical protein